MNNSNSATRPFRSPLHKTPSYNTRLYLQLISSKGKASIQWVQVRQSLLRRARFANSQTEHLDRLCLLPRRRRRRRRLRRPVLPQGLHPKELLLRGLLLGELMIKGVERSREPLQLRHYSRMKVYFHVAKLSLLFVRSLWLMITIQQYVKTDTIHICLPQKT